MATLFKKKRKDGTLGKKWYGLLRINGKRVERALHKHKPIAQSMLDDLEATRTSARHGTLPKDISWNFFKMKYLQYCQTDKSAQTVYRDTHALAWMEDTYPLVRLSQVTPQLLETLKFKWQKSGGKSSMITRAIKSIKTAMRKAEQWEFIAPQNWLSVKVKEPVGRLIYWTIEEYESLLNVCKGAWLTGALLGGRAGLRSGEQYWLEHSDINYERHQIWIHPKPQYNWKPKGAKERYVDMEPGSELELHLKSLVPQQGFVLGPNRPTLYSYQVYMKRLIKKAKLMGSPHTMRHTFASHLISSGKVSLEDVGALLGHSNSKTTKIYSHLAPYATRRAITHLPKLSSVFHPVVEKDPSLLSKTEQGYPRRKSVVLGVH